MDLIQVLGLSAAFFITVANFPQAAKVIRTRNVKSLSASTYTMLFIGMVLWVFYGIQKKDIPIILGNTISGILCGIILIMKIICRNEAQNKNDEAG